MRKSRSLPLIPPLSLHALDEVQQIEKYAKDALYACVNTTGSLVNPEKALRILRTCVIEVFEIQLEYYGSLPHYRAEWVTELRENTIDTAVGLMPMFTTGEPFRDELRRTIQDHLKAKARAKAKPERKTLSTPSELQPLNKQLEALRNECHMTVEDVAEAIKLAARSVYRHLSGDAIPRHRQIAAYEALFSEKLNKKIHLTASSKRQ
jgi:hypothetical protein